MIEEWRDIKDFEGFYQVSSLGNIRSLDRLVNGSRKKGLQRAIGKPIKPQRRRSGHYDVLLKKNGLQKRMWVHRIVAQTFLDNPDSLPIVNHLDHNPGNNEVSNLEWCTQGHNVRHCHDNGRGNPRRGERSWSAKLTEAQVLEIRNRYKMGEVGVRLAKEFKIHPEYIYRITSRKNWKHLP